MHTKKLIIDSRIENQMYYEVKSLEYQTFLKLLLNTA